MTLKNDHLLQQGRYQIRDHLGQGGMGTVYLAEDLHLSGRLVAIKENSDAAREVQVQFEREAITLARLSHPNLPRVTDHFIEPSGRQYLVMDYVQGDDLRQLLHTHGAPFPEKVVLAWFEQVMDALNYMHHWSDPITRRPAPIVHRDIKPSNIKQTPDGRIVLVDFGLAKAGETTVETLQGARAVTPGYSPLEQYTGGTSTRSDIYALGATLYTLTTGHRPLEAPALAAGATLPLPRKLNPALSRATERVILRAMQLQPAERYSSIQEMHAALFNKRQTKRLTEKPLAPFTPDMQKATASQQFPAWWSQSFTIGVAFLLVLLLTGGVTALFTSDWMTQWLTISLQPPPASTQTVASAPTDMPSPPTDNRAAGEEATVSATNGMTTALSATAPQQPAAADTTATPADERTSPTIITTTVTVTARETVTVQATFTPPALSTTPVTRVTPPTRAATSTALPTHTAAAPHTLATTATTLPTATSSATPSVMLTPTPPPTVAMPTATPTEDKTVVAEQTRQTQLAILNRRNATLTASAPPTATAPASPTTPVPQPTNTMVQLLRPTATPSPDLTVQAVQTAHAYETLEQRVLATLTARAPTATPTAMPTATSQPTPTVTPQPTATPIAATATATVTHTPPPIPTATPTPIPTSTPPPLPTNTLLPAPTATPALPVSGSLTLLEPTDAVLKGRRTFRWSTTVTLAETQYFELVFWPAGRDAMSGGFGPAGSSKEAAITVDLDRTADTLPNLFQSGQDYEWGVLLVELNPYRRLLYLGGGHRFRFERSGGGGGGSAPAPTNTPRG